MESKEVLAKLQEMGEFVRSASSTVEAPVVRKLVALYPDAKPTEEKKPVKKAAAKKTAASKKTAEVNPELAAELAAELGVDLAALKASRDAEKVAAEEAKATASEAAAAPVTPATPKTPAAPRPGNNPFSTGGAVPRPPRPSQPRPGNNPFSTGEVLQRDQVHHVQQVQELELVTIHHVQVAHQHLQVHIVHKETHLQVVQPVDHNVQVAVLIVHQVAAELLVHLERMQVNLQSVSRSHVRRCAKNSTICRHHNLVAQLFLTAMERRIFVCVAVHPLQILPKRLAQIQQLS